MKDEELIPIDVDRIPDTLKSGLFYISEECGTSCHLCPCGCGEAVYLNFPEKEINGKVYGWNMTRNMSNITFRPSVGNTFKCRSHYYITNNKIVWI